MIRPAWVLQQIVPPLGLTYFFVCWRICTFDLGPGYISSLSGIRAIGHLYSAFATLSILFISILYLRLYFLPRDQSSPPFHPPLPIRAKQVAFECLSPAEAAAVRLAQSGNNVANLRSDSPSTESTLLLSVPNENGPLVNRCYRDQCRGRWKPPRARHCSLCGTCRAGFDHHCAIFANCLTAPHIPTFLCLLSITPPTVMSLVAPMGVPLVRRAMAAWRLACEDEGIRRQWWDWKSSWLVAGGPMGRWVGGLILGWKVLDSQDGGGANREVRLQIGVLAFLGLVFSSICIALAIATVQVIRPGNLTVDRERLRSHSRARLSILKLQRQSAPVPQTLVDQLNRYADRRWFFIPISQHAEGGVILPTAPDERAYDLGPEGNWQLIMGKGWGWLIPWEALRRGMSSEKVCQWPIADEVEARLKDEAQRIIARSTTETSLDD